MRIVFAAIGLATMGVQAQSNYVWILPTNTPDWMQSILTIQNASNRRVTTAIATPEASAYLGAARYAMDPIPPGVYTCTEIDYSRVVSTVSATNFPEGGGVGSTVYVTTQEVWTNTAATNTWSFTNFDLTAQPADLVVSITNTLYCPYGWILWGTTNINDPLPSPNALNIAAENAIYNYAASSGNTAFAQQYYQSWTNLNSVAFTNNIISFTNPPNTTYVQFLTSSH